MSALALPPRGVDGVVSLGLAVGTFAACISIVGLLWHLDMVALSTAGLISAVVVAIMRSSSPNPKHVLIDWRWMLAAGLPLLVPAALCFSPPFTWDEVAYSVALPRDYARAGYFFYNADYGAYSAFPSNFEALVTVAIAYLRGPAAAKLLNILFVLGLFIVSADFARLLGARKPWLAVGGLLFVTSSAVTNFSFVAKSDIFAAFFEALSVLMAVYYLNSLRPRYVILAGFFLGTAIGAKYSCLQFAACMVPLLIYYCLRNPLTLFANLQHLALFCVTSAGAAAPWYLRNVWLFHDPLFPFLTPLFGSSIDFKSIHAEITNEMFNGLSGFSLKTSSPAIFVQVIFSDFGRTASILGFIGILFGAVTCRSSHIRFLIGVTTTYTLVTFALGFWESRYFLCLLVCYGAFAPYAICCFLPIRYLEALQFKSLDSAAALLVAGALSIGALNHE